MASKKKILVVEGDGTWQDSITTRLELHEGYAVLKAEDGETSLQIVKEQRVELILMEVDLPDYDGRELCRLMRRDGIKSPIVLVGGAASDADVILGLDSGASDYIVKPFKPSILQARLRAQIRQFEQSDDVTLPIRHYAFRPSTKILTDTETEKKIHLTDRETSILKYLYRMDNRPAARRTLLDEIWGYNAEVTTHTLESHIYRLRQKVEPDPSNVQILVTEPEGYRLVR